MLASKSKKQNEDMGMKKLFYYADRYTGESCSSKEGRVYWISEEESLQKELAPGMESVIKLIHDDTLSEYYSWNEDGIWKGKLL